LETLHISSDLNKVDARFAVQTVIRPQSEGFIDYRGYAGRIASGIFRPGDEVVVLPSGCGSKIKQIDIFEQSVEAAFAPMSVNILLEDDIDLSRGDMIVKKNNQPEPKQDVEAMICWLHDEPARPRTKFSILHTTNEQKAIIKEVLYKMDINSLERVLDDSTIAMNDICRIKLRTTQPLMTDPYRESRATGSCMLIDDTTNETVAGGMIL